MTLFNTRFLRRWPIALIALVALASGCSGPSDSTTIAIVNNLNSLDPIVDAFQDDVAAGMETEVEFIHVDFRTDRPESAIEEILESDPDLVLSLTASNSLMLAPELESSLIPQIFGMVTDPVGTKLVDDILEPGHGRTGVGLFHLELTLELAVGATGAQHVGVLHQPSDPASARSVALLQNAAASMGVELMVLVVEDDTDLDRVMISAPSSGIDLLFVAGSPFAARNLGRVSLITRTWTIPTASALTVDTLPEGFMIGVSPDSSDLGQQLANRALAVLNGRSAGEIPIGEARNTAILDIELARRYGITVPDGILARFDTVIGGN